MIKAGDKVYCIKEFNNERIHEKFEIGKFYYVYSIIDFCRNGHHNYKACIGNTVFDLNYYFRNIKFCDYFITNKEYRKQKLEKLKSL